mmetsp:Transcript_3635/g.12986  ORF Transcript_3635/g.12986 Transcript_3635/m.12986 type:complete len:472 (+) Transcript_3635:2281-3696(+)
MLAVKLVLQHGRKPPKEGVHERDPSRGPRNLIHRHEKTTCREAQLLHKLHRAQAHKVRSATRAEAVVQRAQRHGEDIARHPAEKVAGRDVTAEATQERKHVVKRRHVEDEADGDAAVQCQAKVRDVVQPVPAFVVHDWAVVERDGGGARDDDDGTAENHVEAAADVVGLLVGVVRRHIQVRNRADERRHDARHHRPNQARAVVRHTAQLAVQQRLRAEEEAWTLAAPLHLLGVPVLEIRLELVELVLVRLLVGDGGNFREIVHRPVLLLPRAEHFVRVRDRALREVVEHVICRRLFVLLRAIEGFEEGDDGFGTAGVDAVPFAHHHHLIKRRENLWSRLVNHRNHRHSVPRQFAQNLHHLHAHRRVEPRRRFVEEYHRRIAHEGARDEAASLLSSRCALNLVPARSAPANEHVLPVSQIRHVERAVHHLVEPRRAQVLRERERRVEPHRLLDRLRREQHNLLRHVRKLLHR